MKSDNLRIKLFLPSQNVLYLILETFAMFTTIALFEISAIFVLLALTMATFRIFSSVSTLGLF